MAKLYMTVGIPGSGKSTYVNSLKDVVVVSSDGIREELFGDAGLQFTNKFLESRGIDTSLSFKEKKHLAGQIVFGMVFDRCREALSNGSDVVLDATSLSKFTRGSALSKLKGLYSEAIVLYFDVPLERALENNNKRTRHVPENIIASMFSKMEAPSMDEGFSRIEVIGQTC